jgi:hypothetical protein
MWCVVVYDLKKLVIEEAMTRVGSQRHRKKNVFQLKIQWTEMPSCFVRERRHSYVLCGQSCVYIQL